MRKRSLYILLLVALLALLFGGQGMSVSAAPDTGRTYYVSPRGNDDNPGTRARPWKTIARVNRGNYERGDKVLLKSGKTFQGNLQFDANLSHGTAERPVTVGSYGRGRATIKGGINLTGVGGLTIQALNLKGGAANAGAGVSVLNGSPITISGFRLVDVDISSFPYALLVMTGDPPSQIRGIHLEHVSAHQNAAGPSFFGYLTQSGVVNGHYGIGSVHIAHSEFFNNSTFAM